MNVRDPDATGIFIGLQDGSSSFVLFRRIQPRMSSIVVTCSGSAMELLLIGRTTPGHVSLSLGMALGKTGTTR